MITTCDTAAIAKAAANRKRYLFGAFCEFDKDDLAQEAMLHILKAADVFDPSTASRSTFAYIVAQRRILDVWRQRSRQWARERATAKPAVQEEQKRKGGWADDDLAEWVIRVRAIARATYGSGFHRVGRRHYRLSQAAAVLMLQVRLNLPSDRLRDLFQNRPDLTAAAGFKHPPNAAYFRGLAELTRKRKYLVARTLQATGGGN